MAWPWEFLSSSHQASSGAENLTMSIWNDDNESWRDRLGLDQFVAFLGALWRIVTWPIRAMANLPHWLINFFN